MGGETTGQRLFLRASLAAGSTLDLDGAQTNYLVNVLRMSAGDSVLVFNGADGEWRAVLTERGRRSWALALDRQERPQGAAPDLHYLFAPLKHGRLDYMVQKAVEMGAGRLAPVLTRYTQVTRVNVERMEANAIEAAEQCRLLSIPTIDEPVSLDALLDGWRATEPGRRIIFCDEAAPAGGPIAQLRALGAGRLAILIGPEGGFSPEERTRLRREPFVVPISLGPRVLRADTAAVAALAVVQAVLGDWQPEMAAADGS